MSHLETEAIPCGIQLADKAPDTTKLSYPLFPRVIQYLERTTYGPDGEVYSLDMWRALLDELSWDFSRLRFTDIKAIVNSLFQYSSIHKAPQRGGDLLESPAKVSLIESFAHPVGLTYISISEQ